VSKPRPWADPGRPLDERLAAAEIEIANRDTGEGRRAVMREMLAAAADEIERLRELVAGYEKAKVGAFTREHGIE
jgi:molybdate-binding protein